MKNQIYIYQNIFLDGVEYKKYDPVVRKHVLFKETK